MAWAMAFGRWPMEVQVPLQVEIGGNGDGILYGKRSICSSKGWYL